LISYTILPPGTYRLRIEAVNEDGMESDTFSGLEFSIPPLLPPDRVLPGFWPCWDS
jgi:hypothetical protein